jgi:uncharacterized protein YndB with AHSA1/START domain
VPSLHQQEFIDAPVAAVWRLVGDPNRHPEWWPTIIEADCSNLEQGCRYRAVEKGPFGRVHPHEFVVDELEDCHSIKIHCPDVGVFTNFVLTEARGGTFVDAEFGAEPTGLGWKLFGATLGRRYLRRWLADSLRALKTASTRGSVSSAA